MSTSEFPFKAAIATHGPQTRASGPRWMPLGVAGALTLFMLPGCFYPAERGRLLEAKVDTLSAKNQAMEAELAQAKKDLSSTLPRIDEKVREVTQALDSLDQASRRSDADATVQLQKTVEDVAQLRGQVETYLYKITELENQLKGLPTQGDAGGASGGEAGGRTTDARRKLEQLERPRDKRAFLSLAEDQRKAEDFAVARQLYGEWLKKWPRDALAGEAHFGLGETYFQEKKCREALFEYGKVIQEHARSKVAPTAYLRSSDCFRQLKMPSEANLALEELVKNYPRSPEAKTAKEQLGQNKKKSGKR